MSTQDELKVAQGRLERLQSDQAKARTRLEGEIEGERQGHARADVIQDLQEKLSRTLEAQNVYIHQAEAEIARLTADINMREFEQQTAARAELEKAKTKRRQEWISRGGSPESFEAAWPQIQREIIEGREQKPKRPPIIKSL